VRLIAVLAVMIGCGGAVAQDRAGVFDYWVLALSWNASWCALEGDARQAAQCRPGEGLGFSVHGLWPQHERGWPQDCPTAARDPSRRETAAMADIMGSGGLAWRQWRKHGRCSGLEAGAYFALVRAAWERVNRPAALRRLGRDARIAPGVVEAAFLEANPGMVADGVTVTCGDDHLREVRICLTRDLAPRACARDAARDCRAPSVALPAMR